MTLRVPPRHAEMRGASANLVEKSTKQESLGSAKPPSICY
jgi:hypothetical protein